MKRCFKIASLCGLLAAGAMSLVLCLVQPTDNLGYDFGLRMHELECLRKGVDPFKIWNETVFLPPYVSNSHKGPKLDGCDKQVNAYVPWEYALMLPFSYLPHNVAWWLYFSIVIVCWLLLLKMSLLFAADEIAPCLALLVVAYALFSDLQVGNFATLVLCASLCMAWCLRHGYDFAAGFFWVVAMVKPQLAALFTIPLLMKGKWKTIISASVVGGVLSIVPMFYCDSAWLELLFAGPMANVEYFQGCGTCPYSMCAFFSQQTCIYVGVGIGLAVCVWMTMLIRKEFDWPLLLMPAAICGSAWSYAHSYCHAMGWFLMFVLVRELIACPRSKFLWLLTVLAVFSLARWPMAMNGLCGFMGWRSPFGEYALRCVDSLNSTLSLSLAAAFCVWYSTHSSLNKNS